MLLLLSRVMLWTQHLQLPLQRGVDLPSLDVTYFTSLSYYILLLFGLRGVFMLFFRENTIDETQMYRQQMGMGGGNPMAAMTGTDPNKALEGEKAALEMVRRTCNLCLECHPLLFPRLAADCQVHAGSRSALALESICVMAGMQHAVPKAAALISLLCMWTLRRAHPPIQVDHKWKLEGAEERAAQVLRASLKNQPGKSRQKTPAVAM